MLAPCRTFTCRVRTSVWWGKFTCPLPIAFFHLKISTESTQVHIPLSLTIRASNVLNETVPQCTLCYPTVIPRKPLAALNEPRIIALPKTQEEHRHSRMLGSSERPCSRSAPPLLRLQSEAVGSPRALYDPHSACHEHSFQ